jgi:hypothetical protein
VGTERVLALQRSAGNAAVGALLQRYLYNVPQEGRDLPYHQGDYDPRSKPNIRHLKDRNPAETGADAVYTDNQAGSVVEYPQAHAQDHKDLIEVAEDLISLLIRRADRGISGDDPMYMIGVIEHVDVLSTTVEPLRRFVATRSARQPPSFKETLTSLAGLRGTFKLEGTGDLPPVGTLKEKAPGITTIGEGARENLKDCAAKKLVLSGPPLEGTRAMTEVLYDPEGEHPVAVELPEHGMVRFHHRQRVPSCADCANNLPHLHKAMTTRLETVKAAATAVLSDKPLKHEPSEKPLKNETEPLGLVPTYPVTPDPSSTSWAREALEQAIPKSLGSPIAALVTRVSDADKEFRERISKLETGMLDYHWHEKLGRKEGRPPDLKGAERTDALKPLVQPKTDIINVLTSCTKYLTDQRKNPYLHSEASQLAAIQSEVDKALAATHTGPAAEAIKALESEVAGWLGHFGPLPKPASPPEPAEPLENFLASDKAWQEAIAPHASKKKATFGVPVTVDEQGRAVPVDLDRAMAKHAELRPVVAALLTRIRFKAKQPGRFTILLSYGAGK